MGRTLRSYAVLAAVGVLALGCGSKSSGPAGPTPSSTGTSAGSPSSSSTGATFTSELRAVYYVGSTPLGPRLYREFHRFTCTGAGCLDRSAVAAAVTRSAVDPDYGTAWPRRTAVRGVTLAGGTITVDLHGDLHDRPAGLSARRAGLAIQQVLYTAQAAFGHGRLPVQLLLDGHHTDTVLGVPAAEPLANDGVLATLSHVNLSSPAEGAVVTGSRLRINGVANSFEANVVLRLQRYEGTFIAFQRPVTASGWQGDRLYPFHASVDIAKVTPGKYVLMAMTDDPSGRGRFFSDTKVITIR